MYLWKKTYKKLCIWCKASHLKAHTYSWLMTLGQCWQWFLHRLVWQLRYEVFKHSFDSPCDYHVMYMFCVWFYHWPVVYVFCGSILLQIVYNVCRFIFPWPWCILCKIICRWKLFLYFFNNSTAQFSWLHNLYK